MSRTFRMAIVLVGLLSWAGARATWAGTGSCEVDSDCNDGFACTLDSCVDGFCVFAPNNAFCNDSIDCSTDTCDPDAPSHDSNGCVFTPNDSFCDDFNPCKVWTCDAGPDGDGCVFQSTFASCDDFNPCTENDACDGNGSCAGTPISCDDGNPCTDDSCDGTGTCVHTPRPCLSLDPCNPQTCNPTNGLCETTPVTCDDGDPCTDDFCVPCFDGVPNAIFIPCLPIGPNGEPSIILPPIDECTNGVMCIHCPVNCDDGNPCTEDSCDGTGTCVHTDKNCDDEIDCTIDSCDPQTGACIHTPDNTACDDGLFCNGFETCNPTSGCQAGLAPICDDGDPCTVDACVEPDTSSASATVSEAIDFCTHTPVNCDDGDPCTADSCQVVFFACGGNGPTPAPPTQCGVGVNGGTGGTCCSNVCLHVRDTGASLAIDKSCFQTNVDGSAAIWFSGTVSNSGCATLFFLTVTDDGGTPGDTNDDMVVYSTNVFSAGASAPYDGNYVPMTCGSVTDTVTAVAFSTFECVAGTDVRAQTNAICEFTPNPCLDVTKACQDATIGQPINYSITVTNCGDVALTNVVVEDIQAGASHDIGTLGVGESASFSSNYTPTACGTYTNFALAYASACDRQLAATNFAICVVTGCEPPGTGCRVTGGGIVTNTSPSVVQANFGGQVGAPVGTPTPYSADSDCIQGEWQHVRHIKGPPATCDPILSKCGSFHASSFDSLECACLACDGEGGEGQNNTLCGPEDVCGAAPPQVPANKICFSGVGNYRLNKGKKTPRNCVFRVDLEDHGEPGGEQGTPPPDRYRIRIWFVGNAESPTSITLRQAVACADPRTESVGTSNAPDIDDGGDLINGNVQIHPQLGSCP